MKSPCKLLLLAQLCAVAVRAQGGFQDLDFESANVILDSSSPYYPNAIDAANAFPGWTVSGSVTAPDVFYNDISLGAPAISLQGAGSLEPVLQGNFSAFLQGPSGSGSQDASITQTGQIPAGAESLLFYGENVADLQVAFNGHALPYLALGNGADYTIYGADITTLAGQTGPLTFTALPGGEALLDNIQFSPNPIPEPAAWMLLMAGMGIFGSTRLLQCGWRGLESRLSLRCQNPAQSRNLTR